MTTKLSEGDWTMSTFEKFLCGLFLDKLPSLPPAIKESTAKILPWIFIVFGVLGVLALLSAYLSFSFVSMLAMGMGQVLGLSIPAVGFIMIYLVTPAIQILSIAGGYLLLKKQFRGWQFTVFATLLSLISHLLYLSPFGLIVDVLFLYLLFQVRERYTC
jgi:hypothetical protein